MNKNKKRFLLNRVSTILIMDRTEERRKQSRDLEEHMFAVKAAMIKAGYSCTAAADTLKKALETIKKEIGD